MNNNGRTEMPEEPRLKSSDDQSPKIIPRRETFDIFFFGGAAIYI